MLYWKVVQVGFGIATVFVILGLLLMGFVIIFNWLEEKRKMKI